MGRVDEWSRNVVGSKFEADSDVFGTDESIRHLMWSEMLTLFTPFDDWKGSCNRPGEREV